MSMVRKRLELMVAEFSKISWKISLELLLMYSTVFSRYPLFFLKHAGEVCIISLRIVVA
jgi:hypothetical protein